MPIIRAAEMLLTDGDVGRAAARFALTDVVPLGGFENALFRTTEGPGRVLRITHTSRRSLQLVEAEVRFMQHLAAAGVAVVEPIPSPDGALVEEMTTDSGEQIVVMAMTQAPGRRPRPHDLTDARVEEYGSLVGAMHQVAAVHEVPEHEPRRPTWLDPVFDVGFDEAPRDIQARFREIRAAAAAHAAGGVDMLIHQDLHLGNLFVGDQGFTVFDFDDCAYGTPTHDIAIALFYWPGSPAGDPLNAIRRFLPVFVRGYERQRPLPEDWPDGLDHFLSFREIDIYWLVARDDSLSPWETEFMQGRRERILDGVPTFGRSLTELVL